MNWFALWIKARPFLPYIAIASLLIACVAWIDHRGYKRAEADAERRWQEQIAIAAAETRRIEGKINGAVGQIDTNTGKRIDKIRIVRQTVINNLTKELSHDPRYYDREFALSDSVRENINRARSASSTSRAVSYIEIPLPPTSPAQ